MPPPKAMRAISQQAFDEMVKENIDDLGMDPTEALDDVIETLTLQGVDLSGIVTCLPGESDPLMDCLRKLKEGTEIVEVLDELTVLFKEKEKVAVAARNGGVQSVISVLPKLRNEGGRGLASGLNVLAFLINDLSSSELFRENNGPKIIVDILSSYKEDVKVLGACFSVVAAAATGNEVIKESFMELKIAELVIEILKEHSGGNVPSIYDAIRVILTSDDNRVVASQVFGYARKFAKLGVAEILVESLREGRSSSLTSAIVALKAVAVNDEICRSITSSGGIDVIFRCIDDSSLQGDSNLVITCCSLLCKLAGSDANKSFIVEKGGFSKLLNLSARFSDDPLVLQEVMSVISTLCLRSPENAAMAIECGAGDLAVQAMQTFPHSEQLQRKTCFMVRNLSVRNPENRKIFLGNGIEELIRRAKKKHKSCKDAATDALRDLGLDNYNS